VLSGLNRKVEGRTLVHFTFYPQFSAILLDEIIADDQSQSGAGFIVGASSADFAAQAEEVSNHFAGHPNAVVLNRDMNHFLVCSGSLKCDFSSLFREFHAVGNQVSDDRLKDSFVGKNFQVVGDQVDDLNLLVVGRISDCVKTLLQKRMQAQGLRKERDQSLLHP